MFAVAEKLFTVRAVIAFVKTDDGLELFNTDTRESIRLEITYQHVLDVLRCFDGRRSVRIIAESFPDIDLCELIELVTFLNNKNILIEIDCCYVPSFSSVHFRTIGMLENSVYKRSDVVRSFEQLQNRTVLVVGMGAVGTWVVHALSQAGVRNFTLADDDIVDVSNLHRQDMYFEADVGRYKIDCVEEQLNEIDDHNVLGLYQRLDDSFFVRNTVAADLVINCSDSPSVDATSRVVAEFCMEANIPHIIGGGYNLHLTLLGHAIIPFQTACFECMAIEGRETNDYLFAGVKKLHRPNRKIGSFGPLCTLSASVTAMEALKLLTGDVKSLVTSDRRLEFNIRKFDFESHKLSKRDDCTWCGEHGRFVKKY